MVSALNREADRKIVLPARREVLIGALAALLVLALLGPMMTFNELPLTGEGNPARQIAYMVIFAIIVFTIRPLEDPKRLLAVPVPFLVALGWCWLSMIWAIEPAIGVRRLILTTIVIWSVLIGVRHLTYTQTTTLLRIVLAATLLANYVMVFGFPQYGIHQIGMVGDKKLIGDWSGLLQHKNVAGAVTAITILAFLFDAKRIHWSIRVGVVVASAYFLIRTESKTSMGVVCGAIVAGAIYMRYLASQRAVMIIGIFLVTVVGVIVLFVYKNPLTAHFNDPTSFTGRVQIWNMLVSYSSDNLLLGSGFGSFWNIGGDGPALHYSTGWVSQVASGHNGYLDLLAQVGIPGLILVVVAVLIWPTIRLLSLPDVNESRGALAMAMLFFCVGQNSTEFSIFDRDMIVNVFLLFAIAMIMRLTSDASDAEAPRRMSRPSTSGSMDLREVLR